MLIDSSTLPEIAEPPFPAMPRTAEEIDRDAIQAADLRALMPAKIAGWILSDASRDELREIDAALSARDRYLADREHAAEIAS